MKNFLSLNIQDTKNTLKDFLDLMDDFLNQDNVEEQERLVIGAWDTSDTNSKEVIQKLIQVKDRLKNLKSLTIGYIAPEIRPKKRIFHCNMEEFLLAFPQLEVLSIRGSDGLSLGDRPCLENLRQLEIDSHNLDWGVVSQINDAYFPRLRHLDLCIGEGGFRMKPRYISHILEEDIFPELIHLGIKNTNYMDNLVPAIVNSCLMEKLDSLNFSWCDIMTKGARAICNSTLINNVSIDLTGNCLSEKMVEELEKLKISIDLEEQRDYFDVIEMYYG